MKLRELVEWLSDIPQQEHEVAIRCGGDYGIYPPDPSVEKVTDDTIDLMII